MSEKIKNPRYETPEIDLSPERREDKPKIEVISPAQKRIIEKLVSQLQDVSQRILERVAKGDISSESGKEELIAEIDNLLDQPFKHEK